MENVWSLVVSLFPDGFIYLFILLFFLIGLVKCVRPVLRNAGSLRRAADMLEEGARAGLVKPVWRDGAFLGKRNARLWREFLRSEELASARGLASDVADFVHEDSMITVPANAALADWIPGSLTSLGILGTFVGLLMGISGLDMMNVDSYIQLTNGIAVAFITSIVGLIGSLLFNSINRMATGRLYRALDLFYRTFYQYGVPQPADAQAQLLALSREQADSLAAFAQDVSRHIAAELQSSIAAAMAPVQRSMEDFMSTATRAQVDGLDYIVARFIDRMNVALGGSLEKLKEMIEQTVESQEKAQDDLAHTVDAVGQVAQTVVNVHGASEQMINRFTAYVSTIEQHYREIADARADGADLLEEMNEAAMRQADNLAQVREYQLSLAESFRDYSHWTDRFVSGLAESSFAQEAQLTQVAMEMRASADLLRSSYKGFVESIELGLANALGLFDENMQGLTQTIQATLSQIQRTMAGVGGAIAKAGLLPPETQKAETPVETAVIRQEVG